MSSTTLTPDGVHAMVPRELMTESARKLRDTYAKIPGAPIFHKEFWLMPGTLERWKQEGMPQDVSHGELFGFDEPGDHFLGQLGWCEAAFQPCFAEKLIEDRGDKEIMQDFAGRHVLFFKKGRCGYMPEYIDHPVKDQKSWEEQVKWRLDPLAKGRFDDLANRMVIAQEAASQGKVIVQNLIGGYMYLRSLIGPQELFYMFYDQPELIHNCMQTWLTLSDAVIARHQQHVSLDMVFLAEDICYNHGSLVSPDMMQEFLLPYYQQLLQNTQQRQIDGSRKILVQVDTDGFSDPVIPIYQNSIGMDMISPFEVASGSDVIRTGREFPELILSGGLDKRILAQSKHAIDHMVESIIPTMRERGGYIPTIDHGTPEEVPYENYVHFRRRMIELGG